MPHYFMLNYAVLEKVSTMLIHQNGNSYYHNVQYRYNCLLGRFFMFLIWKRGFREDLVWRCKQTSKQGRNRRGNLIIYFLFQVRHYFCCLKCTIFVSKDSKLRYKLVKQRCLNEKNVKCRYFVVTGLRYLIFFSHLLVLS